MFFKLVFVFWFLFMAFLEGLLGIICGLLGFRKANPSHVVFVWGVAKKMLAK